MYECSSIAFSSTGAAMSPVLRRCGCDRKREDEARDVDEEVAFASFDLLGCVVAIPTSLRAALDALTVEDSGRRLTLSPIEHSSLVHELVNE
jgi:hypothetical protein